MTEQNLDVLAEKVADLIINAKKIVVFTGAGISTESGIPDFRSPGGIWSRFDPDDFTYQKFVSDPEARKKHWQLFREGGLTTQAQPNAAHYAIAELDKLLREYPDNVEIINSKAWALLNNGSVDEAFNTWKKALKEFKNNTMLQENMLKARFSVARRLREGGLFNPALVHFKDLLKYKPNEPEVHYEIGCIYLSKGDIRTAIQEFQKTVDIDPRNQQAKKALSDARLKFRR